MLILTLAVFMTKNLRINVEIKVVCGWEKDRRVNSKNDLLFTASYNKQITKPSLPIICTLSDSDVWSQSVSLINSEMRCIHLRQKSNRIFQISTRQMQTAVLFMHKWSWQLQKMDREIKAGAITANILIYEGVRNYFKVFMMTAIKSADDNWKKTINTFKRNKQ